LNAWNAHGAIRVAEAVAAALPLDEHVRDPEAIEVWHRLGWEPNNVAGLTRWAERRASQSPQG
jgi:hypothetical protein